MTPAAASTSQSSGPPAGGPVPARPLAAQAHALRAAAAFIECAGIAGLSLTIDPDRITIQVPECLAGPACRATAVAHLAATAGGRAARDTAPGSRIRGWVLGDGEVAGHAVRIFTPIEETS
jgi:hypothetical protein